MAGGLAGNNNYGYWLYTGQYYWTMSPYSGSSNAVVFYVGSYGNLRGGAVHDMAGVRPVINLKSDVSISGNGTKDTPYEVSS